LGGGGSGDSKRTKGAIPNGNSSRTNARSLMMTDSVGMTRPAPSPTGPIPSPKSPQIFGVCSSGLVSEFLSAPFLFKPRLSNPGSEDNFEGSAVSQQPPGPQLQTGAPEQAQGWEVGVSFSLVPAGNRAIQKLPLANKKQARSRKVRIRERSKFTDTLDLIISYQGCLVGAKGRAQGTFRERFCVA